ncbi:hypothetical protein CRUP_012612 [Coryphaenoides rupestris]|nr:hypothetical protein CRUP_012612 [Coryphaenoides rupestris]
MEESYQFAVKRDTTQNIRSYSFELKYLLTGHASAFQGAVSERRGRGSDLIDSAFPGRRVVLLVLVVLVAAEGGSRARSGPEMIPAALGMALSPMV